MTETTVTPSAVPPIATLLALDDEVLMGVLVARAAGAEWKAGAFDTPGVWSLETSTRSYFALGAPWEDGSALPKPLTDDGDAYRMEEGELNGMETRGTYRYEQDGSGTVTLDECLWKAYTAAGGKRVRVALWQELGGRVDCEIVTYTRTGWVGWWWDKFGDRRWGREHPDRKTTAAFAVCAKYADHPEHGPIARHLLKRLEKR